MEKKRINVNMPIELYDRIKTYADSVNSTVNGVMCMFADNQLTAMQATKMYKSVDAFKAEMEKLADRFEALKNTSE